MIDYSDNMTMGTNTTTTLSSYGESTTMTTSDFSSNLTSQMNIFATESMGSGEENGFTTATTTTTAAAAATEILTHYSFQWPSFSLIEIGWITLYTIMLSIAVLGNIIVIWIVLAHRSMRTVTNYFLLNLSVADLILATFNGAPNFFYMLLNEWIFGSILCVVNNFVANFTVAACVFTMTAISIDRWMAIIRPLEPRMTKGSARRAIVGIWVGSAILAAPCLFYSALGNDGGTVLCLVMWPETSLTERSTYDLGYNVCFMTITYIIPMMAMAICYGSMSWELWGQQQIGEETQRQIHSTISKRKVVRMFIVVVTTFGVCWFPYHAYFIYEYHDSSIAYIPWFKHLYLSFYFLAMSTSMINPIVYYFMNTRFRNYIQEIVFNFFCCRQLEANRRRNFLINTPPMFRRYSQSCSRSRSGTGDDPHHHQMNRQTYPKALVINTQMYYYHHPMAHLSGNLRAANGVPVTDGAPGTSVGRAYVARCKGPCGHPGHQPLNFQPHHHPNGNGNTIYCNTYC